MKIPDDLQKSLYNIYQTHDVMTWISPLQTQVNNICIDEVYVSPNMQLPGGQKVSIKNGQYDDILYEEGKIQKRIYVIGNVGTGKSSFCKMAIQDWCKTQRQHNLNKTRLKIQKTETNSTAFCGFDFLFYVSLKHMPRSILNILEMVRKQYSKSHTYENIIETIFKTESHKCLVLADGLDEWTIPNIDGYPPHNVSFGLPVTDTVADAVVITTSRPAARGILNMKTSECDRRIDILGIEQTSVEPMIEKYMAKMEELNKTPTDFLTELNLSNYQHIEETPLLLQQMVCMFCNGHEIGKSANDIYSVVGNIVIGWSQKTEETIARGMKAVPEELKVLQLPERLSKYPRCEKNTSIILLLGHVSYEILTKRASVIFSRTNLSKTGLSDDAIAALLTLGFITETRSRDPTLEDTQCEFIHKSYLEFFAAVYIASKYQQNPDQNTFLVDMFNSCKSVENILQLENTLVMVCGLAPLIVTDLFDCIYDVVLAEEKMIYYRMEPWGFKECRLQIEITHQLQQLAYDCLLECTASSSNVGSAVKLCDIAFCHKEIMPQGELSKYIHLNSVRSVCIIKPYSQAVLSVIENLAQIQTIKLTDCCIGHSQCEMLTEYLRNRTSVKVLSLKWVQCEEDACKGHKFDLFELEYLQVFTLLNCKHFYLSRVNTNLISCVVKGCTMPYLYCETVSAFAASVTKSTSLEHFEIENILCFQVCCEGHSIDLSTKENLRTFTCINSVKVSDINTSSLEIVELRSTDLETVRKIRNAPKLKELTINSLGSTELVDVKLQTPQLKHLALGFLNIESTALTVSSDMQSLENIHLSSVSMSIETWSRFIDSVLTLKQSVHVETFTLQIEPPEQQKEALDYVRNLAALTCLEGNISWLFEFFAN